MQWKYLLLPSIFQKKKLTRLQIKSEDHHAPQTFARLKPIENVNTPIIFVSKLTDVDMENSETQGWLEFSKECGYISIEIYNNLYSLTDEVGRLVQYMINNPGKFGAG